MARNKPAHASRYFRLQLVFSDRDADLKAWLENNQSRIGAVVRQSLRDWLATNQELPDGAGAEIQRANAPAQPAVRRAPAPKIIAATPVPLPTPAARPAAEHAPAHVPPPATVRATAPEPTGPAATEVAKAAPSAEDRNRLKRLLGGNKDFA